MWCPARGCEFESRALRLTSHDEEFTPPPFSHLLKNQRLRLVADLTECMLGVDLVADIHPL
jgi:hypothetical protein